MKSISLLFMIMALSLLATLLSSCKREMNTGITEEEAIVLIALTISSNSEGLNYQITSDGELIKTDEIKCGETKEYNRFSKSSDSSTVKFSYSSSLLRSLSCDLTQKLTTTMSGNGQFDAPRISGDDIVDGKWIMSGFEENNDELIYDGLYERIGTANIKVMSRPSFSYDLKSESSNILFDKNLQQIISGSASVILSGQTTYRGFFNYSASILFLGNDLAEIIINGNKYKINLITGEVL